MTCNSEIIYMCTCLVTEWNKVLFSTSPKEHRVCVFFTSHCMSSRHTLNISNSYQTCYKSLEHLRRYAYSWHATTRQRFQKLVLHMCSTCTRCRRYVNTTLELCMHTCIFINSKIMHINIIYNVCMYMYIVLCMYTQVVCIQHTYVLHTCSTDNNFII